MLNIGNHGMMILTKGLTINLGVCILNKRIYE
jgi:hypothetical protein